MKGFVSYSHEDHRLCGELLTHLRATERECRIKFWADHRIAAGYDWTDEIANAIKEADVCIMLVSAQFIASDYIYKKEIPAIDKQRKSGALVMPVILRECSWQMLSGVLQAVPTISGRVRPITKWSPQNDGFDRARDQITTAIRNKFGIKTKPRFGSVP
jgi:hypothetical protein